MGDPEWLKHLRLTLPRKLGKKMTLIKDIKTSSGCANTQAISRKWLIETRTLLTMSEIETNWTLLLQLQTSQRLTAHSSLYTPIAVRYTFLSQGIVIAIVKFLYSFN